MVSFKYMKNYWKPTHLSIFCMNLFQTINQIAWWIHAVNVIVLWGCAKLDVTKWQQLIVGNKRDSKLQHVCTTYLTELIDSNMFVIEMCKAWCTIPSFLKCIKNAVKGCFHLSWTSGGKPFSAKCSAFLCLKRQSLITTPEEDTNRNTLGKHKWVCCA